MEARLDYQTENYDYTFVGYQNKKPVYKATARKKWDEDTWLAVIMLTVYFVIPVCMLVAF
ncbi:hypothetical protein RCXUPER_179 [Rhodobacter phage RcXuper]|nr:hypothetical protein RCXUPER_179 [Rhodobacter phage RcXuper]